MMLRSSSSGFALLLVLWTLVMLSAVALSLAASAGVEVRSSQDSWEQLQSERLASSAHELALYLETRAMGTASEDLSGLQVTPTIPGLRYRAILEPGTIEMTLEGENGKWDLSAAKEEENARFLAAWTGGMNRASEIAAAIADWMDSNDEVRPFGAESAEYLTQGYRPRNGRLGVADLFLIRGMTAQDFSPSLELTSPTPAVRNPITDVLSAADTGAAVNPNYAPRLVLQSLPGMTRELLDLILELRSSSVFRSSEDFRTRAGVPSDSPILSRLTYDRGSAPAVTTIARLASGRTATERRVQLVTTARAGAAPRRWLWLVQR